MPSHSHMKRPTLQNVPLAHPSGYLQPDRKYEIRSCVQVPDHLNEHQYHYPEIVIVVLAKSRLHAKEKIRSLFHRFNLKVNFPTLRLSRLPDNLKHATMQRPARRGYYA